MEQRRAGAPGKRYKSMVEAKIGMKRARKCGLCKNKSRSMKCSVRKEMGRCFAHTRHTIRKNKLSKRYSYRSQPKGLPKGELNGFSYEEIDKTNMTV